MLSMFVEVVKHLVLEQCMAIQQKMTSASGRGSGGTSDQGRVSVHMDGVSSCAIGVSASKASMLCYPIKCHAGAYSNYALLHSYNLYATSIGPLVGYVSWLPSVSMTIYTILRELIVIQWVSTSKNWPFAGVLPMHWTENRKWLFSSYIRKQMSGGKSIVIILYCHHSIFGQGFVSGIGFWQDYLLRPLVLSSFQLVYFATWPFLSLSHFVTLVWNHNSRQPNSWCLFT